MAQWLKQSTAYTFRLGPFVDEDDGKTAENSLTIAYTSVLLSKAGGALAAKNETTNLTGTGANAHYTCVMNTTDTNTLGGLRVYCHVSGALPVWVDFEIVPANVYDSLIAGTDYIQSDVIQFNGESNVEGSITPVKAFRALLGLLGKVTGGGTATITYRDTTDALNRIVMTVDADGNRSAVTLTLT